MEQSPIETLWLKLEDWRLQQHLRRVESILRDRDVSHLSPGHQQAREQYLDRLHAYAVRGIFPRNHERLYYAPCFVDRDGRECAVAHLMMTAGRHDAALKIAAVANYAYVPEMKFSELDDWAAQTGSSSEELALIQPGYYFTFTGVIMAAALALWTVGVITLLINVMQMARKQVSEFMPNVGLAISLILLLFTGIWLLCLNEATYIATNSDVGFVMRNEATYQANLFTLAAVISLMIAILNGGIGFYRLYVFARSENDAGLPFANEVKSQAAKITDKTL